MLPTEQEINPWGDVTDGWVAVCNLLGKSTDQAANLLVENSDDYAEDYLWMGPVAFCYYIGALNQYLGSADSDGDFEFAYSTIQLFCSRVADDQEQVKSAIPQMLRFCRVTVASFHRLGVPGKYEGRIARRVQELESAIAKLESRSEA